MSRIDSIRNKVNKLSSKGKLDALVKLASESDPLIRAEVALGMGQIKSYESGMALIPLLRDPSPQVRANAATAASMINAAHCEEYVKKLAFADSDPNVRTVAREAFDKMKSKKT